MRLIRDQHILEINLLGSIFLGTGLRSCGPLRTMIHITLTAEIVRNDE